MAPARLFASAATAFFLFAATLAAKAAPLDVCNYSSFVVDSAIGFETNDGAATKGWFRVRPGTCIEIVKEDPGAERLLLHVRPLNLYGAPPEAESPDRRLCVRETDFVIAGANECSREGQVMADFVVVAPREANERRSIAVDEPRNYSLADAQTAAIQRLLSLIGYDVGTIDGLSGTRTKSALDAFLDTKDISPTDGTAIIDALVSVSLMPQNRAIPRFCNETFNRLMLSVGFNRGNVIETRGWFEMAPGACVKPINQPIGEGTVYTYAEAVDQSGVALLSNGSPVNWAGDTALCTKNVEYAIRDHKDCGTRGLSTMNHRAWNVDPRYPLIIRFESPIQ